MKFEFNTSGCWKHARRVFIHNKHLNHHNKLIPGNFFFAFLFWTSFELRRGFFFLHFRMVCCEDSSVLDVLCVVSRVLYLLPVCWMHSRNADSIYCYYCLSRLEMIKITSLIRNDTLRLISMLLWFFPVSIHHHKPQKCYGFLSANVRQRFLISK